MDAHAGATFRYSLLETAIPELPLRHRHREPANLRKPDDEPDVSKALDEEQDAQRAFTCPLGIRPGRIGCLGPTAGLWIRRRVASGRVARVDQHVSVLQLTSHSVNI